MLRLVRLVLSRPKTVLGLLALATLGFGAAAARVQIDPSLENMILGDDPDLVYYKGFLQRFGSDEFVIIALTAPELFHADRLASVRRISNALAAIRLDEDPDAPVIDQVISLSTVVRIATQSSEDDQAAVSIDPFLGELPETAEERQALWSRAVSDPLYVGNFLSSPEAEDPDRPLTTLILGRLVIREGDLVYRETVKRKIEEILARERTQLPPTPDVAEAERSGPQGLRLAGVPILKATLLQVARVDLARLVPVQGLLTYGLLWLLFRTWAAVLLPLATVGFALAWVVGLLALSGSYLNVVSVMILPLVQVIGIASTIHIFSHYYAHGGGFGDRQARVRNTLLTVGWPCFLASLTTAIGFLALTISSVGPVREVGLYSAFGVMVAFLFSVTMVPLALLRAKERPLSRTTTEGGPWVRSLLSALAAFADRFRWPVVAVGMAVVALSVSGMSRVRVETDLFGFLEPSHELREADDFMSAEMGGIEPLDVTVTTWPGGLLEPEVLARIDRFQTWLEEQPEIDHTFSIVGYLKRVNQSLHGDDPAFFRLPQTRAQVASALLLLEDSVDVAPFLHPYWEQAEEARVLVRIPQLTSVELRGLIERCRTYLREAVVTDSALLFDRAVATPPITGFRTIDTLYYDARGLIRSIAGRDIERHDRAGPLQKGQIAARVTGVTLLYSNLVDELVDGQITSLTLAFVFIWATVVLVLRSPYAGTVAMIPNLFPIVVLLGIMGFFGVALNITTAMIGSICIGIAVDDTIHFMTRYRLRLADSPDVTSAIERTLQEVGRPIVSTSVALAVGFAALLFSEFRPNREFGVLSAVTIVVALVGDLVLLPACLHVLRPRLPAPGFSSTASLETASAKSTGG